MPPQLDVPSIPIELSYIWDWWVALDETRQVGMDRCHITYTEIAHWSILLKINVTAFEVRCIMALDSAYLSCCGDQKTTASSGNN
jgi:hypothetical protein